MTFCVPHWFAIVWANLWKKIQKKKIEMKKRPNRQKRSEPVPSSGESGAINGAVLVLALLGAFLAGQAINNTGCGTTFY